MSFLLELLDEIDDLRKEAVGALEERDQLRSELSEAKRSNQQCRTELNRLRTMLDERDPVRGGDEDYPIILECAVCDKVATQRCARCPTAYCDTACQQRDWDAGHREACQEEIDKIIKVSPE